MILAQVIYATFCILFAYLNYYLIEKKGKRIYHFWNGLIHIAAAVAGLHFFNWQTGVCILLVARLFFDVSLNLFRRLPIDYVSPKPKSWVDIIEKKIFGNDGIFPKVIYFASLILLNIF
jgi:hypothetical protein